MQLISHISPEHFFGFGKFVGHLNNSPIDRTKRRKVFDGEINAIFMLNPFSDTQWKFLQCPSDNWLRVRHNLLAQWNECQNTRSNEKANKWQTMEMCLFIVCFSSHFNTRVVSRNAKLKIKLEKLFPATFKQTDHKIIGRNDNSENDFLFIAVQTLLPWP